MCTTYHKGFSLKWSKLILVSIPVDLDSRANMISLDRFHSQSRPEWPTLHMAGRSLKIETWRERVVLVTSSCDALQSRLAVN